MKSFESVYKELENLFIKQLPDYIEKVNKSHNDGIILKSFENNRLDEECINRPSFIFELKQSEYTEKDRIIETTIYSIEIKLQLPEICNGKKITIIWRYVEAIAMMLNEQEIELKYEISDIFDNIIQIKIFNE